MEASQTGDAMKELLDRISAGTLDPATTTKSGLRGFWKTLDALAGCRRRWTGSGSARSRCRASGPCPELFPRGGKRRLWTVGEMFGAQARGHAPRERDNVARMRVRMRLM